MLRAGLLQPSWLLSDLLAGFAVSPFVSSVRIEHVTLDSRQAGPGSLFLACAGTRGHGLDYAAQAAGQGCAAIAAEPDARWGAHELSRLAGELGRPVVPVARLGRRAADIAARFFSNPSAGLRVFGVTGTNGKTSVSHFLAQTLDSRLRCGVIGNLGSGFPGEHLTPDGPLGLTTPDPVALQALLQRLAARGAAAVSIAVSSHALDQGRADSVQFSHAILTNLSRDHLDYHGDMAAYANAKRRLFRMPGLAWAVLNFDDAFGRELIRGVSLSVQVALYSTNPAAELGIAPIWVRARSVRALPRGLAIAVETSAGDGAFEVGLIGRFNAANVLAVLATLLTLGLDLDTAITAVARLRGVPGRMECFGGEQTPLVVVDYAHSPAALEQALTHLRDHCAGRVFCVFGCGGERDPGKRPLMGAVAEQLAEHVVITEDNPRFEDAEGICADILAGMGAPTPERVEVIRDRGLAIRRALAFAGDADAVLVAGKGHETMQDLGELRIPFSDRAQVIQALVEKRFWRRPAPGLPDPGAFGPAPMTGFGDQSRNGSGNEPGDEPGTGTAADDGPGIDSGAGAAGRPAPAQDNNSLGVQES